MMKSSSPSADGGGILCSIFLVLCIITTQVIADTPTCQPSEYHYEFTECDETGQRWRVAIPNEDEDVCIVRDPPVVGPSCDYSCEAGQFLDIDNDMSCKDCPAGTFSTGGGIMFDQFSKMPAGFDLIVNQDSEDSDTGSNCESSLWRAMGNYISSNTDTCPAVMTYVARLKKPGYVSFEYQYTDNDMLFRFYSMNDQCQARHDTRFSRWPLASDKGEWLLMKMYLNTGTNILHWFTQGVNIDVTQRTKPVRIRNIFISGIAYASECTKCYPGTHASDPGSSMCDVCPENTFAPRGAIHCSVCEDSTSSYSDVGSGNCTERPQCSENDFYEYQTPCDANKKTQKIYKWIMPKICRGDVKGAAQLPLSGRKEDCPPCNKGMTFVNRTQCDYCPVNSFSDGVKNCMACPPNTAPNYGMTLQWWNSLPPNMGSYCLNSNDLQGRGCATAQGWQLAGDHIHSGQGHSDDAYLMLFLTTDGFRGVEGLVSNKPTQVGKITFEFETICSSTCHLYFSENPEDGDLYTVKEWVGHHSKRKYSYKLTQNGGNTFSWAFMKSDTDEGSRLTYNYANDTVVIYSIEVENTVDGGAGSCTNCPIGVTGEGCIPCPTGQYLDSASKSCISCPADTYVNPEAHARDQCLPCGPGTRSEDGISCYSDCTYTTEKGQTFNFTQLHSFQTVLSAPSFTAQGTRYYHWFNISLCGEPGGKGSAICNSNVSEALSEDIDDDVSEVQSMICRSTIIPPVGDSSGPVLSVQPTILGDHLVAVTESSRYEGLRAKGFSRSSQLDGVDDINFYYKSSRATTACHQGRSVVITLRCADNNWEDGLIELPTSCPDGTCDGCNFNFLWHTPEACPLCTQADITMFKGECIRGKQQTHYKWQTDHRICRGGLELPEPNTKPCPMIGMQAQLAIAISACLAVMLVVLVCYFWKRTRKLEYKYQKLMQAGSGDGEFPAPDTCVIQDGEEDEDVTFSSNSHNDHNKSKGMRLFTKLMSKSGKSNKMNDMETMNLTHDSRSSHL